MNFLIVANDAYIKYAKSLIYSISLYQTDYQIFLYLINPELKNLRSLTKKAGQYNLNINIIEKNLSKEKLGAYSEEAAYSANIRGELLADLSKTGLSNLTYLDADSLIINPFSEICPADHDLALFVRNQNPNLKKTLYFSGLISLNISQKVMEAMQFFASRIDDHGIKTWYSDQAAVEDLYFKYVDTAETNKLKLHYLTKDFFDWGYDPASKIWMGKGKSKSVQDYINKQIYYESQF